MLYTIHKLIVSRKKFCTGVAMVVGNVSFHILELSEFMFRYLVTGPVWVNVKLRSLISHRNFLTQLTVVSTEGVLLYWRFAKCDTEQIFPNWSFDIWKSSLKINSNNIAINIKNSETEPHFYNAIQPSLSITNWNDLQATHLLFMFTTDQSKIPNAKQAKDDPWHIQPKNPNELSHQFYKSP